MCVNDGLLSSEKRASDEADDKRRQELFDGLPVDDQPLGARKSSYQEPPDAIRAMTTMERPLSGVKADVFQSMRAKSALTEVVFGELYCRLRACVLNFLSFSKGRCRTRAPYIFIHAMIDRRHDYYVFTSRRGDYPERWSWEIRRKSKPLGVKLTADGFQSDVAAQFAGKRALEDFLCELSKEEKHQRK